MAALAALALTAGLAWLDDSAFARNVSLFVLPFLAGYFAWKRQVTRRIAAVLLVPFVLAAVVVNVYPFEPDGSTEALLAIHVRRAVVRRRACLRRWRWRSDGRRMDFIRFTGEWAVYMTLLGWRRGTIGLTRCLQDARPGR